MKIHFDLYNGCALPIAFIFSRSRFVKHDENHFTLYGIEVGFAIFIFTITILINT